MYCVAETEVVIASEAESPLLKAKSHLRCTEVLLLGVFHGRVVSMKRSQAVFSTFYSTYLDSSF